MDAGYPIPGREYGLRKMSKYIWVVGLLLLTSCAKIKPVINYTCMGCSTLISSGLCSKFSLPHGGEVITPTCKEDEFIVIDNWKGVARKGEVPKLSCERMK